MFHYIVLAGAHRQRLIQNKIVTLVSLPLAAAMLPSALLAARSKPESYESYAKNIN